jgi:hypothetical protein
MGTHCDAMVGGTIRMALVLVSRMGLRHSIAALVVAAGISASALIPGGLTQSNPAPPAPAGVSAEADRQKSETGREEAARAADAGRSPSGRMDAVTENQRRAFIIMMFQNGANTPFGFFK